MRKWLLKLLLVLLLMLLSGDTPVKKENLSEKVPWGLCEKFRGSC